MIRSYFELARATNGFKLRFLTKEKSFSTAAILEEYGAKYMSGSPSASN